MSSLPPILCAVVLLLYARLLPACNTGSAPNPIGLPDAAASVDAGAPPQDDDLWPDGSASSVDAAADLTRARGQSFVVARSCPACHQSNEPVDGVLSGQTAPRPGTRAFGANLTPDEGTGLGGWSNERVIRAIRAGIDDEGDPLCAPMPHFTDMPDDEADAIVAYLRSLAPVKRAISESECAEREPELDAGEGDEGEAATDAGTCTMSGPDASATCNGCGRALLCQPNGCHGGYWCNIPTSTCRPRSEACR